MNELLHCHTTQNNKYLFICADNGESNGYLYLKAQEFLRYLANIPLPPYLLDLTSIPFLSLQSALSDDIITHSLSPYPTPPLLVTLSDSDVLTSPYLHLVNSMYFIYCL